MMDKQKRDKQWDEIKEGDGILFGKDGEIISGGDKVNTTVGKDCYKKCFENEVIGWTFTTGLPSVIKYCNKAIGGLKKICNGPLAKEDVGDEILPKVNSF